MKIVFGLINVMLIEHDRVRSLLKEIRELTKGYEVPNYRCPSFQLFYKNVKFLETDTHFRIHKRK